MQNTSHYARLIEEQAQRYGQRDALMYRDYDLGQWKSISWTEFASGVQRVSRALVALGVEVQERVAVFSQNKPECLYVDFGAYGVRAITIPFYATSSVAQVAYMMNDAEVRFVFVGEQEQYDTMLAAAPLCSTLHRLIVFDDKVVRAPHDSLSMSFSEFLDFADAEKNSLDAEKFALDAEKRKLDADFDDIANILYTSGTTGVSKGVILTHANYRGAMVGHSTVLPVNDTDLVLNFLPFTHVFERGWSYYCLTVGATLAVNLRPQDVQRSMQEVHPTCMAAVPRFWEKVYHAVLEKAEKASNIQRALIMDTIKVGGEYWECYQSKHRPAPLALRLRRAFHERTVLPILRKAIGIERSTCFPTAGAAISPEVERFVHAAGIDMYAGYGLTETTATVTCDHPWENVSNGSIGRLLPGVEVKIDENDEILVKGPTVTPGYYRKPEETERAFTPDGWFRTGDAGFIRDGELYMTERIKDLFKTSNGKYVAPQHVEGKLAIDRYIEQVVVVADRRQFVSALIVPSYNLLETYCRDHDILCDSLEEMCENEEVRQMIWERIETLQQDLAHYEQVKRFVLLPRPFSLDNDEITNTLKVKRRVVYQHFAEEIDKMYK